MCKYLELNDTVDGKIKKGANLFWGGVHDIDSLVDIEMDDVVGFRMASDKR